MQASKTVLGLSLPVLRRSFLRNASVSTASIAKEDDQLKTWNDIPGPWKLPIIGTAHHFIPPGPLSDLTTMPDIMYKKYGPLVRLDGGFGIPTMLFLYDTEAIAFVLRSENSTPIRPGFMSLEYYRKKHNKAEEEKRPTGLITDHGENWKYFRTTVNPVLMQPKTIKLYTSLVDEVALDMIERMKSVRNDKNMIDDFMTEMNKWSLESIAVVALGGRLNCFDPNLAEDSPERQLIKCVHEIFDIANELDFKPNLWRYFSTKTFKKGMQLYKQQEELAEYFIQKSRKEMLANKKPDDEKGILEKLLEIDERVAIIMACDMVFAGVDTVATSMAAVLYLLATNQDKQDKLRTQLNSGEDSKKYLKACIKESMRMLPVVSGDMRQATKEYEILGYRIPEGTFIVTANQYLGMMESQFPRPNEYIPERWVEDGPLSYKGAHPFSFIPFGFGVRSCVGRRIAELELETFLTRVIQNFKVEWTGPAPAVRPTSLNYFVGPFGYIFKDV